MLGDGGGNDADEKALLSLVQGGNGKTWSASLHGWSAGSGIPICDWDGVACNVGTAGGPSVVVGLNLTVAGLLGTIPTELGLLTGLETLMLKNNMLQGPIPHELASLDKLTMLDLTGCFLTGTLPQRFESSNLTTLNLANNAISGRFFQEDSPHLRSIRQIRMENNLLTGTLHGHTLTKMLNLRTLSLSDNDFSGLIPGDALGSLASLHHLYLDSNHFVGPLPGSLARAGGAPIPIFELWVQDNALSGTVPASYARFDHLHDFYLDGNKLTGALPPAICGPQVNADFFENVPPEVERNYCHSIACPAGSVALEGMYPCEECPGGEAARLKNRYLGQQGKCVDQSQRDILKIFHRATTKGGPWRGSSDWDDDSRPICRMTGVTCDVQGNVVEIMLKDRGLQGHIPDEIGLLYLLETLDVSDNGLMGYVPSDLQWTSLSRLDVSGNKLRGIIPLLLCKMEGLNGNGAGNGFHCDRIACPVGTFNAYGFHHGADGERCQPCDDDSPYIARKECVGRKRPLSDWKDAVLTVKETSKEVSVSAWVVLGILGTLTSVSLVSAIICWAMKFARRGPERMYIPANMDEASSHGFKKEEEKEKDMVGSSRGDDCCGHVRSQDQPEKNHDHGSRARYDDRHHGYSEVEEFDDLDDYSFASAQHSHAQYRTPTYRDDPDEGNFMESDSDEEYSLVSWSHRNATDFIREHQGIALNRRQRLRRALSERMSPAMNRRAREAASGTNVGARRRLHWL